MSLRALLTVLLLPPVGFALAALAFTLFAWRGRRWAGLVATLLLALQVALATPFASLWLQLSLDRLVPPIEAENAVRADAIVVLGADLVRTDRGWAVGPLTLERMAAAAALHRQTGLPLLVTGGPAGHAGAPSLAVVMAETFDADFGLAVRWIEPRARDTRENARFAVAMLHGAGIGSAYLVTHAWHLPRSLLAVRQAGGVAIPAAARRLPAPEGRVWDFVPRADRWAASWLALREWVALAVYAWREG